MTKPIYIDSTISVFTNKPDFRSLGFAIATLVTNWGLFATVDGEYDTSRIDLRTCRLTASNKEWWDGKLTDMIVLDEEYLDVHTEDLCQRDLFHDQLIEAIRIYRAAFPGVAIGYYGRLPENSFYAPLSHARPTEGWAAPETYPAWVDHNKQFFGNVKNSDLTNHKRGLASQVDRVFPSMYQHWSDATFVNPLDVWKDFHDGTIAECEQYQKPIMPYLSPKFAGGGDYFADGIWGEMLRHSLAHPSVDGVVIFQGTYVHTEWDESAAWWQETLNVHNGNR